MLHGVGAGDDTPDASAEDEARIGALQRGHVVRVKSNEPVGGGSGNQATFGPCAAQRAQARCSLVSGETRQQPLDPGSLVHDQMISNIIKVRLIEVRDCVLRCVRCVQGGRF